MAGQKSIKLATISFSKKKTKELSFSKLSSSTSTCVAPLNICGSGPGRSLLAGSALIRWAVRTWACGSCVCLSLTYACNYSGKISAVLSRKCRPGVSKV